VVLKLRFGVCVNELGLGNWERMAEMLKAEVTEGERRREGYFCHLVFLNIIVIILLF